MGRTAGGQHLLAGGSGRGLGPEVNGENLSYNY